MEERRPSSDARDLLLRFYRDDYLEGNDACVFPWGDGWDLLLPSFAGPDEENSMLSRGFFLVHLCEKGLTTLAEAWKNWGRFIKKQGTAYSANLGSLWTGSPRELSPAYYLLARILKDSSYGLPDRSVFTACWVTRGGFFWNYEAHKEEVTWETDMISVELIQYLQKKPHLPNGAVIRQLSLPEQRL